MMVYRNDLMSITKVSCVTERGKRSMLIVSISCQEQAGVIDQLMKDPTLPRSTEHNCPQCGHHEYVLSSTVFTCCHS
jgi:DNA-directed RNA polymerase II subunit RPB9